MNEREIYPNAPLRFVAFELRMPTTPELAGSEGALPAFEKLRDVLPIIAQPQMTIEISSGEGGPPRIASGPLRLLDRRRVISAVIGPAAILVENTDYRRYEDFLEVVERTLRAVSETAPIAGMQRVGLRYIDEIRVPTVEKPADWQGYINPALLAPLSIDGDYEAVSTTGVTEYRIAESQAAALRFGALNGRMVEPSGPLRLKSEELGPYFLIDIDSFWTAPEAGLPEFSVEAIIATCSELRRPVRSLFESAITDKLRDEVLRRGE